MQTALQNQANAGLRKFRTAEEAIVDCVLERTEETFIERKSRDRRRKDVRKVAEETKNGRNKITAEERKNLRRRTKRPIMAETRAGAHKEEVTRVGQNNRTNKREDICA
jgi:hypothetical protein